MSWTTVIWSATAGICLTLAGVHFFVWLKTRDAWASLFFSIAAVSAAATSVFELSMMHAPTPEVYDQLLRGSYMPTGLLVVSVAWFVRFYLRAGSIWLIWLLCVIRALILALTFVMDSSLHFREITGLRQVPVWGEIVVAPVGVANPWAYVGNATTVLLIIITIDAAISAWRRGDHRQAAVVGGTITSATVLGIMMSVMLAAGMLQMPYSLSLVFLIIVLGMAYELSANLINAGQLSRELYQSRERMSLAANAAKITLWEWDIRRDKVWTSKIGRARARTREPEPMSLDDYMQTLNPDDRERTRQAVREAVDGGRDLRVEFRTTNPSGEAIWLGARGQVERDARGKPLHLRGISVDITERKRAEEALRESEWLLQQAQKLSHVGNWSWSVGSDTVTWSEELYSITGRDPTLPPPSFAELAAVYTPASWAMLRKAMDKTLRLGEPYELELDMVRSDGTVRHTLTHGTAIKAQDGRVVRLHGTVQDITSHKEAEEQRRELAHMQRVSAMGQLSSTLAHELNQPLGAILRNAEAGELFLKQDLPDMEEVKAILADIRRDDQRATAVIERMRSLLKRRDLTLETLSVNELIEQVAAMVQREFQMRHVTLRVEVSPTCPEVRGDRVHLQQVILNLMLNSLDAMDGQQNGERQVVIRASESGDGIVEIAVIDRGTGIAPDKLQRIFEPFETTKTKGTGIGLAISKKIIELHGGHIWAENNPQGGATVRFTLNVMQGEGEA